MLFAALLQRQAPWQFDWRSALIGAAIAWIMAGVLYAQRQTLKNTVQRIWKPLTAWRRRMQSSEEEKYLRALQDILRPMLLFAPRDPETIFAPPTFLAPAALPEISEDGELPPPLSLTHTDLLDGHPRLIITGAQATGRTTALLMLVWETARRGAAEGNSAFTHFPVWLDLANIKGLASQYPNAIERIAQLAGLTLTAALPKWLSKQLTSRPALILVDNWEKVPAYERDTVAQWLAEAAESLPNSIWIVATSLQGYGPLVEHQFTPVEIVPAAAEKLVTKVVTGWQTLLHTTKKDTPEPEPLPDEIQKQWVQAAESGASALEINLRAVLYWQQQLSPARFTEAIESYLELKLPTPDLGEDQIDTALEVRRLAIGALQTLAYRSRMENRRVTTQELDELLQGLLPPEVERPPKMEAALKRMIHKSDLLTRVGKELEFKHYLWQDYLTASVLADDPNALTMLEERLHRPKWHILMECYVGISDVTPLVRILLQEYQKGDDERLFQVVRWAALAPEDAVWRKAIMKLLAQVFVTPHTNASTRMRIGRAILLAAGASARAFFLQALRQPSADVRATAIRGLGWVGTPQDMAVLSNALNDEHHDTRMNAIQALTDLATPGAIRLLKNTLLTGDEQLSLASAKALALFPEGWDALKDATGEADLLIRRAASQGLGLIHEPWATELLRKMAIEDTQWLVRSSAEGALAARQEKGHVKVTVPPPPKPENLNWLMSWAAQQGLGLGVGKAARQTLYQALSDGDPETQMLGALTLAYIGYHSDIDVLIPLTHAEHATLQQAAQTAIVWIQQRYLGVEDDPPPAPLPEELPATET